MGKPPNIKDERSSRQEEEHHRKENDSVQGGVQKKLFSANKATDGAAGGQGARKAKGLLIEQSFPRERNLQSYIYKIMKKVQPEIGANKESMGTLNSIILHFYDGLAQEAMKVSKKARSQTLKATDVQTAARLLFPQEIGMHAINHAATSVSKYANANKNSE